MQNNTNFIIKQYRKVDVTTLAEIVLGFGNRRRPGIGDGLVNIIYNLPISGLQTSRILTKTFKNSSFIQQCLT